MDSLISNRIKYGLTLLIMLSLASCNMLQNEEKAFHDNGNLLFRVPLKEGKEHGTLYQYYDNGDLQLTSNWEKGVREGLTKEYHQNSNVKLEGLFKNGKPYGKFREYFKSGKLFTEFNFNVKGELTGDYLVYYENGILKNQTFYVNNQYEGYYYEYFPDGKLRIEILYEKGKILYSKQLTENGNIEGTFLTIDVKPQSKVDKYIVGEKYRFAITLVHPGFEDSFIGINVGELDKDKNVVSSDFEFVSDSLTAYYEVTPQKEGKQRVSGTLQELITKEQKVVGQYFFDFEFDAIER